ncbi:hypothetical protein EHEL_021410 [Encephalitozoon hellem ATCC 50504]|uniref:Kinetochore protein Spc24 n=1 Tax=Encephalitozoon hellem TaxID=27973 RepID=A0A9Q9C219_ENCHE|nr:uncharacterized protein EHEL_021410 [Encephalitozoon hellem ATCC 50504]AFM97895.1 hypothetical protein EHEL_021410 [Encephalitozoon hellem ATCC 50504]UTX42674.1 hypothetical protein GPU96_02g03890 [Encephalitozoon hellem]WEL38131.1 hypothetical protein PFJ87_02g01710 [Encephalitozoon hellem]|eukprot:XP_003886876.1 hypothetical protein EHEL_021410 [Encephalitozoon hellem ATCC 50504]
MEEAKTLLQDLCEKFKNPVEKNILVALDSQRKEERMKMEAVTKALQENVQLFKKKNIQLEGEVRKYSYTHSKKNDAFMEINNEKLKLAKKIVELEDENEKIKVGIIATDKGIQEKEERLRTLSRPSFNEIYLEIVKGFGIEFLEGDGRKFCRIKNRKISDVFTIDIGSDISMFEITNAIWEKI